MWSTHFIRDMVLGIGFKFENASLWKWDAFFLITCDLCNFFNRTNNILNFVILQFCFNINHTTIYYGKSTLYNRGYFSYNLGYWIFGLQFRRYYSYPISDCYHRSSIQSYSRKKTYLNYRLEDTMCYVATKKFLTHDWPFVKDFNCIII